jgi:hypothetical protein
MSPVVATAGRPSFGIAGTIDTSSRSSATWRRAAVGAAMPIASCRTTFTFLIETPVANLSEGMQRLNSRHAIYFNRRYGHTGHLFQGRFHSELVHSDSHLLAAVRYILMNPVRASLCRRPGDWTWSSHRATAGAEATPPHLSLRFVLSLFAGPRPPRAAFVAYIDDS